MNLLSIDTNTKTIKGQAFGYMTGILYLAPADYSGRNVCVHSSEGCRFACLFSAGRGAFANVISARLRKTLEFFKNKEGQSLDSGLLYFRNGQAVQAAGAVSEAPCSDLASPSSGCLVIGKRRTAIWNIMRAQETRPTETAISCQLGK